MAGWQARSQEVRGNKDYVESPWLASAEELSALPHLPPPVPKELQGHARDPAEYKGLLRKTSCSSFGMGMKVAHGLICSLASAIFATQGGPIGDHAGLARNVSLSCAAVPDRRGAPLPGSTEWLFI